MKAVIKCRLSSGEVTELCPIGFKWADFDGAEILGGDKYYIEKAVGRGAKKLRPKKQEK